MALIIVTFTVVHFDCYNLHCGIPCLRYKVNPMFTRKGITVYGGTSHPSNTKPSKCYVSGRLLFLVDLTLDLDLKTINDLLRVIISSQDDNMMILSSSNIIII